MHTLVLESRDAVVDVNCRGVLYAGDTASHHGSRLEVPLRPERPVSPARRALAPRADVRDVPRRAAGQRQLQ